MDLRARDPDAAQLFVDLLAAHAFIDEQVHRLAEDGGVEHAFFFPHRAQRDRDVIARHIEPPRPGRTDFRHLFQIIRLTADDQLRIINVADVRTAFGFIHVVRGNEERHPLPGELEEQVP